LLEGYRVLLDLEFGKLALGDSVRSRKSRHTFVVTEVSKQQVLVSRRDFEGAVIDTQEITEAGAWDLIEKR
jgi:hypothetical protein